MDTVRGMAETFSMHPDEHVTWLVECCKFSELSNTFFLLVLLQSFMTSNIDIGQFNALYDACYPVLKTEWNVLKSVGDVSAKESNEGMLDGDCKGFLDQLFETNFKTNFRQLNAKILICVFWRLLGGFISTMPADVSLDDNRKWVCTLQDLFVFFVACQSNNVFQKHLHFLVTKCKISHVRFLSKLFTEEGVSVAVQVDSLHSFAFLCSQLDESLHFQLVAEFPSLLVPLSSDNQDPVIGGSLLLTYTTGYVAPLLLAASFAGALQVLQDFLNQNRGSDMLGISISDMDFQFENFKDLVEDLRSSSEGSHPSWRQPDLYEESPDSSEYSTGSTLLSQTAGDKMEESREELCALHLDSVAESQSTHIGDQIFIGDCENGILSGAITNQDMLPSCEDLKDHDGVISVFSSTEYGSPLQVTPIFRSLAAGVPSPKFSES